MYSAAPELTRVAAKRAVAAEPLEHVPAAVATAALFAAVLPSARTAVRLQTAQPWHPIS